MENPPPEDFSSRDPPSEDPSQVTPKGLSGVVRRARTYRGGWPRGKSLSPSPVGHGVTIGLPTRLFSWDATRAPSGTSAASVSLSFLQFPNVAKLF